MMTENEYLYAWLYYVVGAFILLGCWWYLIRKISLPQIKYTLLVLVAVIFLTPWFSDINQTYLSPALLISVVEGMFEGDDAFWRAGAPLLAAVVFAFVCCIIFFAIVWYVRRQKGGYAGNNDVSDSVTDNGEYDSASTHPDIGYDRREPSLGGRNTR